MLKTGELEFTYILSKSKLPGNEEQQSGGGASKYQSSILTLLPVCYKASNQTLPFSTSAPVQVGAGVG